MWSRVVKDQIENAKKHILLLSSYLKYAESEYEDNLVDEKLACQHALAYIDRVDYLLKDRGINNSEIEI